MGKRKIQTAVEFLGWIYRDMDTKEQDIIEKRNQIPHQRIGCKTDRERAVGGRIGGGLSNAADENSPVERTESQGNYSVE